MDHPHPPDRVQKKRRRPPLACEPCRSRKIRCDREAPCGPCVKSRISACTYAPTHQPKTTTAARRPPAPREPVLAEKPRASSDPVQDDWVYRQAEFLKTPPHPDPVGGSVTSDLSSRAGSASQSSSVDALLARVRQLEEKLAKTGITHAPPVDGQILSHYTESEDPVREAKGAVSKTRYFGQSHWLSGIERFPDEIKMFQRASQEKNELCELLVSCKRLGRRIKENRYKPLSSVNIGKQIPHRDLADQLVEIYLATFEGVLRILHVPTFRAEYERYWQNPPAASDSFVIQLQLCMALGAALYDDNFSLRTMAIQWVHEAQFWLILPPEKARLTIAGIQIRCLLCMARATSSVSHDLIWSFAGSLVRTAMSMGLHRDPRHLTQMTTYRAEMRRRLWATVMELNLQSSFDAGGSTLLSDTDYDTAPPAELDDDELTDEPDSHPRRARAPGRPTGISVQLELMKSLRLRMSLLKHVNEFRSNSSYTETLRLNSELTKACRSLSRTLNALADRSSADGNHRVTMFQISMAEILTYRGFHALHQPVITRSFLDPKYYFSRKMCVESSLKIMNLSGLQRFITQGTTDNGNENGGQVDTAEKDQKHIFRLTVNASGLFRHVRMQALVAASLELIHQHGDDSHGLGYLSPLEGPNLRASVDGAAEWLDARLRAGETNVKGNCFLASCLGHADALVMGLGPEATEELMMQRTTEAARVCWQLMRDTAEREGVPLLEDGAEAEAMDLSMATGLPTAWLGWSWDEFPEPVWPGFPQSPTEALRSAMD